MVTISVMDLLKILSAAKVFNNKIGFEDKKIKEILDFIQETQWDSYDEEILFIDEIPF